MKTTKYIQLLILLMVFGAGIGFAQTGGEYKLDMSSGKLIVKEVNEIEFVGKDGSGVIIKRMGEDNEKSERAKGLKLINGLGLEDNTGIGLSAEKKGGNVELQQISRNNDSKYVVQVPKSVTIVYEHSSPHGDDVKFKNIAGEIEVNTNHSGVRLDNVIGPLTVSTVHGEIEGGFSTVNQSNPISIVTSHGDIDMAIPANTKANLKLSTGWGEIYSDLDIAIERSEGNMKSYGGNTVNGKLNGGGVDFQIKSSHGTIYLRKK